MQEIEFRDLFMVYADTTLVLIASSKERALTFCFEQLEARALFPEKAGNFLNKIAGFPVYPERYHIVKVSGTEVALITAGSEIH